MFRPAFDIDDFGMIGFEQDTLKAKDILDKVSGIDLGAKENLLYLVYSSKISLDQVRSLKAEQANHFGNKTFLFDLVTGKKTFDQVKEAASSKQESDIDFEKSCPNTVGFVASGMQYMKFFLKEQSNFDMPKPSASPSVVRRD